MSDETDAITLFNNPTVKTGRLTLWPTEGDLALSGKELWVTRDAAGLMLAITTETMPQIVSLPAIPTRPHLEIKINSWLRQYVGPRPGMTPTQNIIAHRTVLRAWFTALKSRHPAPHYIGATVPSNWPTTFRNLYTSLILPTFTPLAPFEVYADERGGTFVWGDVYALSARLGP